LIIPEQRGIMGGVQRATRLAACILALLITPLFCNMSGAQNNLPAIESPSPSENSSRPDENPKPIRTPREKWNHFLAETASPLTLGGGTFNAAFSQVTKTDPRYGINRVAFAKRFGASVADIATQNLFGDFVVASIFHEDPSYYRKGHGYPLLYRIGYAISRAAVIRNDDGRNAFNFDNLLGSAMSSAFSNIYYPLPSRTGGAFFMHFWTDVADYGFVNLAPEFWPDFKSKVLGIGRKVSRPQITHPRSYDTNAPRQ